MRAEDLRMVLLHLLFEVVEPLLRTRSRSIPVLGNCRLPIGMSRALSLVGAALLGPIHEFLEVAIMGVRNRRVDLLEELVGQLLGRLAARGRIGIRRVADIGWRRLVCRARTWGRITRMGSRACLVAGADSAVVPTCRLAARIGLGLIDRSCADAYFRDFVMLSEDRILGLLKQRFVLRCIGSVVLLLVHGSPPSIAVALEVDRRFPLPRPAAMIHHRDNH